MTDEYIAQRRALQAMSGGADSSLDGPPEEIKRFIKELISLEDWEAFNFIIAFAVRRGRLHEREILEGALKQAAHAAMSPSEN